MASLSLVSVACSPISAACRKRLEALPCERYIANMEQKKAEFSNEQE
jgi:hypothetical protein